MIVVLSSAAIVSAIAATIYLWSYGFLFVVLIVPFISSLVVAFLAVFIALRRPKLKDYDGPPSLAFAYLFGLTDMP